MYLAENAGPARPGLETFGKLCVLGMKWRRLIEFRKREASQ